MRAIVLGFGLVLLLLGCASDDRNVLVIGNPLQRPEVTLPDRATQDPGALVLVIDRSGSMQGMKLEAAKAAAIAAVDELDDTDRVAMIVFDSTANVLVPLQPAANREAIIAGIERATAGGGTHVLPGLRAADDLLRTAPEKLKHVILMSDGEAPSDGLVGLARDMRARQITISTVAIGDADVNLLDMLGTEGGGRMYRVDDLSALSQIFVKETRLAFR